MVVRRRDRGIEELQNRTWLDRSDVVSLNWLEATAPGSAGRGVASALDGVPSQEQARAVEGAGIQ